MSKRIWSIALAYVGVMIGAGVSSGQDLLQYFVSFGAWGLIGVIVLGILHVGFGRLMIALGSYYRSDDHSVVLAEISHPVIYRILDIALIITCFLFGFVMTAGAGANLNQQFGFPIWVCLPVYIFDYLCEFPRFQKNHWCYWSFYPYDSGYDCHDIRDQCSRASLGFC